jgi:hypothetical protein
MTEHERRGRPPEAGERRKSGIVPRPRAVVTDFPANWRPAYFDPGQLLALQRSAGNAVVATLLQNGSSGATRFRFAEDVEATHVQRQVDPGRYGLNTEGRLREDDTGHTAKALLPQGQPVHVLDKGGRTSLFKADGSAPMSIRGHKRRAVKWVGSTTAN